jgi:hypothetical protein
MQVDQYGVGVLQQLVPAAGQFQHLHPAAQSGQDRVFLPVVAEAVVGHHHPETCHPQELSPLLATCKAGVVD